MLRAMDAGARSGPNGPRGTGPVAASPPRAGVPAAPQRIDPDGRCPGRRRSHEPGGRGGRRGASEPAPALRPDRHGCALWRELVIGFAGQLSELRLGFTQLAALYSIARHGDAHGGGARHLPGCSPSATSRVVSGLEHRDCCPQRGAGRPPRADTGADRRRRCAAASRSAPGRAVPGGRAAAPARRARAGCDGRCRARGPATTRRRQAHQGAAGESGGRRRPAQVHDGTAHRRERGTWSSLSPSQPRVTDTRMTAAGRGVLRAYCG